MTRVLEFAKFCKIHNCIGASLQDHALFLGVVYDISNVLYHSSVYLESYEFFHCRAFYRTIWRTISLGPRQADMIVHLARI